MHERVNILFGLPCLSDTEMYVLAGNCVDVFTLGHYMNLPSLGYTWAHELRSTAGKLKRTGNTFKTSWCLPEVISFPVFFFVLQIGGGHNINAVVTHVAVSTIKESRKLRVQPFNEYRKRFNLRAYASFSEFTGETSGFVFRPHNTQCNCQSVLFTTFTSPWEQPSRHSWNKLHVLHLKVSLETIAFNCY